MKIASIGIIDPQFPPVLPYPFNVLILSEGTPPEFFNLALLNDDNFSKRQCMLNLAPDALVNNLEVDIESHLEQDPGYPNDPSRMIPVLDRIVIFNPHL